MPHREQRRFSRIPLDFPATCNTEDGHSIAITKFYDLSIGGCFIQSEQALKQETTCQITIPLVIEQDGPQIGVSGIITRSTDGYIAIKFTSIDPDSLFLLQNLIRYNADDPDQIDEEINEHPGLI